MTTLKKLMEDAKWSKEHHLHTTAEDVLKIEIYTSSWTQLEDKVVMVSYKPKGWNWMPYKSVNYKVFKRTFKQIFGYDWKENWKDLMKKNFYKTY